MQIRTAELTVKNLLDIESRMLTRQTNYNNWERYYVGENPTITDATARTEPDNRVPVPFARKIVKTLKGYMFKPGYITYKTEGDYIDELQSIFERVNEPLLTADIATEAMISPETYEIARVNERLEIEFYQVRYDKGYPVYDDTLAQKLVAFVHVESLDDEDGTEIRTIYYADRYIVQQRTNSQGSWSLVEEQEHPFGDVPVTIYETNADGYPIFSSVTDLIDEHDKVISSAYANERDRFAQAYLLLMDEIDGSTDADGKTALDKINQMRAFTGLGRNQTVSSVDQAVGFLTKPSRGQDVAEEADRLERLIYDMAMVINPNDESFAATSGIALRYKLLPMEFFASDIQAYFGRGLQNRLVLIGTALQALRGIQPEEVTISWRRNLPTDLEAFAQSLPPLKGVLSDRTLLQQLPSDVVPNVDVELDRLENQIDPYAVMESENA
jgi:SPP1 family phage portal protein